MIAYTEVLPSTEWQIGIAVASFTQIRCKTVGINALGIFPEFEMAVHRVRANDDNGVSQYLKATDFSIGEHSSCDKPYRWIETQRLLYHSASVRQMGNILRCGG